MVTVEEEVGMVGLQVGESTSSCDLGIGKEGEGGDARWCRCMPKEEAMRWFVDTQKRQTLRQLSN